MFDISDGLNCEEKPSGDRPRKRHKSSSDHHHHHKHRRNSHDKVTMNGDHRHPHGSTETDSTTDHVNTITDHVTTITDHVTTITDHHAGILDHGSSITDDHKADREDVDAPDREVNRIYETVLHEQDSTFIDQESHSNKHQHKHKHRRKRKHRHDGEKRSSSEHSHKSHSSKSDSDRQDKPGSAEFMSIHDKHSVVSCGIQTDIRASNETKSVQVPADIESDTSCESDIISEKNLNKKQQRIAYVQQSISTPRKLVKPSKGTPKKEGSIYKTDKVPVHFSEEYSSDSQDNKLWRATVPSVSKYKYKDLMHVEQYSNGGALVCHSYQDEVLKLSSEEKEEFVKEYFDFVYGEPEQGVSNCVMGIVHGAARDMPDLLEYLGDEYANMTVKAGFLGKSDIETMSMEKYREQVHKSYEAGTFRCGPLLQVSLVGTAHEEVGDYFPELLDIMESDPFLNAVMPWGELSSVRMASRSNSNDGPILWTRPGEQMVPTADMPKSPFKRKR